ncbi:hypothetical protein M2454_002946 [Aequitasia blattaphilus]|uniref:Chitin-binding type-2 domain-containing protein n=1 Tax=Aequitasia blattaphilus TaxID=2949332 RepID=A0ABT1ECN1_9FIRM|nr:hypothetical protein [Aequitasia blattaphilus]MCP1103589.1 hypothetical protein [Aequitasia blattaphilus]MCR8616229.1 hypothetical protein [Aequitasia blattaphilus]
MNDNVSVYDKLKYQISYEPYALSEMIEMINILWVDKMITKKERDDLAERARENAKAENELPTANEEILNIRKVIKKICAHIGLDENGEALDPDQDPGDPGMGLYPEYKQPQGVHDAYFDRSMPGNEIYKCSEDGVNYECIAGKNYEDKWQACTWPPSVMPSYWEKIEKERVETNE